jgi:hypothetical protein
MPMLHITSQTVCDYGIKYRPTKAHTLFARCKKEVQLTAKGPHRRAYEEYNVKGAVRSRPEATFFKSMYLALLCESIEQ